MNQWMGVTYLKMHHVSPKSVKILLLMSSSCKETLKAVEFDEYFFPVLLDNDFDIVIVSRFFNWLQHRTHWIPHCLVLIFLPLLYTSLFVRERVACFSFPPPPKLAYFILWDACLVFCSFIWPVWFNCECLHLKGMRFL